MFIFIVNLTGFGIIQKSHLQVCSWECFLRCWIGKPILNMGVTVLWGWVPKVKKENKRKQMRFISLCFLTRWDAQCEQFLPPCLFHHDGLHPLTQWVKINPCSPALFLVRYFVNKEKTIYLDSKISRHLNPEPLPTTLLQRVTSHLIPQAAHTGLFFTTPVCIHLHAWLPETGDFCNLYPF